jgi:AcrR family transcriptional regulator
MNTPNNARSAQSKQKLKKAFIKLLESKKVAQITVGEICKEAGVNRTTFYSHYANVEELYSALEVDLHQFMESTLLPPSIPSTDDDVIKIVCSVLSLVKEHKNIHLNYIDKLFELDYVIELCEEVKSRYMPLILQGENLSEKQQEHIFVFCKTGIVGIIREWLKNGCAEDMESIAHAIVFIMHQIRFKSLY